jgi:hypothetical protein
MSQMSIPASDPNDSDDVALALQTAEALWNKGDPSEAVRWLRRAAEAAGDSGNDMRAVVLAKAAAELNAVEPDQVPKQVRPPPLPPQPPSQRPETASNEASPTNGEAHANESPLSAKGGPKGVSKAPPSPPSARKSLPPKSPASARPGQLLPYEQVDEADEIEETKAAPQRVLHPPPPPPKPNARHAEDPAEAAPEREHASHRESAQHRESVTPKSSGPASARSSAIKVASFSRAPAVSSHKAPQKSGKPRSFARAAVKVYVSPKDQDGDKLEVHLLAEGQRAPAGAFEALLVPLRRGAKLVK